MNRYCGQFSFFACALLLLLGACGAAPPQQAKFDDFSAPNRGAIKRTVVIDQTALTAVPITTLTANFVDRVIHDLPVQEHLHIFARLNANNLDARLDTREKRLTFWLNIYNGYTQYFLKTDPALYNSDRGAFFSKKQIEIAGYTVSMEDIEHGILRQGATIWSLGHIRLLWLRSEFVQTFAVKHVDYRIHFALNCGAKSCPAVVAYQERWIDRQLDDNSRHYLRQEVIWQRDDNIIWVPALMLWFSADFGVGTNKLAILKKHGLLKDSSKPKIRYLPYDWSIKIENYRAFEYL